MRRCLLWVAMSPNGFTFCVGCRSSKRERLGRACSLDSCNLAACGHWWHLYVHFQDMLGKPSRKMFWYRQKWGFLEPSKEMNKWSDRVKNEAIVEGLRCKLSLFFYKLIEQKSRTLQLLLRSQREWKETRFFSFVVVPWMLLYIGKFTQQLNCMLTAGFNQMSIFLFVWRATLEDL